MKNVIITFCLFFSFSGLWAQSTPQEDLMIYFVKPAAFNSSSNEFSPFILKDKVLFISDRDEQNSLLKELKVIHEIPRSNIYQFDQKLTAVDGLNDMGNQGQMTYMPEEEVLIVTTNQESSQKRSNKGKRNELTLTFYKIVMWGWKKVGEFPYNSTEYSVGQPTFDPNTETLYFVSNMPGGKGGTDIYSSQLVNNEWSTPINLKSVNTPQNEMFPFIDANSGELYFSSDGYSETGGLDVYRTYPNSELIVKLGYPINSPMDDFGFILDKTSTKGYFSSNRPGGEGMDDVYEFFLHKDAMVAQLINQQTSESIEGYLEIVDLKTRKTIPYFKEQNTFLFAGIRGRQYEVVANSEGYHETRMVITIMGNRQLIIPVMPVQTGDRLQVVQL